MSRPDEFVECAVCHHDKRPWGRSVPLEMETSFCGWDCPGYTQEPTPSPYWPGERDAVGATPEGGTK